jgi:hypothetical protein
MLPLGMRPSQQLRMLGWAGFFLGLVGCALTALILLWLAANPIRTIGAHGMLPENFYSMLFRGIANAAGIDALFLAAMGWVCSRRGRVAYAGAFLGGALSLIAGVLAPLARMGIDPLLSLSFAIFLSPTTIIGASYVCALGLVCLFEDRFSWPGQKVPVLAMPPVIATVLVGVVYAGHAAIRPYTIEGIVKREIAESRACGDADTLEHRCGGIAAFTQSDSSVVLVEGFDTLDLETFESMPPRRRKWKVKLPLRGDSFGEVRVAVTGDGTRIAVEAPKGALMLDGANGAPLHPIEPCGPRDVDGRARFAMAFSPDGRTIAIGQSAICVRAVDSESDEARIEIGGDGKHFVGSLWFDPAGTVVWATVDRSIEAWDIRDRRRVSAIEGAAARHLALSSDGTHVATLGFEGLGIWDTRSGERLGRLDYQVKGGGNPLTGPIAFLGDGRRLVVLSSYGYYVADPQAGTVSSQVDNGRRYKDLAVRDGKVTLASPGSSGDSRPTVRFVEVSALDAPSKR